MVLYVGLMMGSLELLDIDPNAAPEPFAVVLGVILMTFVAVLFAILLFNRPHAIIPPHLRSGHRGLLGELFFGVRKRSGGWFLQIA